MKIRIAILAPPGFHSDAALTGPDEPFPCCPAECVFIDMASARLTAARLAAVVKRARLLGATHLATLPGWTPFFEKHLLRLIAGCRRHPDALVTGFRPDTARGTLRRRWRERVWPRFWLKMQTGRQLEDPGTPVRLYPLAVLERLWLRQSGRPLATEMVLKSVWADVAVLEVPLDGEAAGTGSGHSPPWEPVWHLLLNIHWTLRSVLPIPHRKLVAVGGRRSGKAISVWRPIRSLRTLLGENASSSQIALAAALGVFLGTLPLVACHSLAIILGATYFRLNKVVALSASQLAMPPVVPALCIEAGYWLRHGRFLTEISLETLGYQALERLYEWLLGALVLAPMLACLMGGATLALARLAVRGRSALRSLDPTPESGAEP